MHKKSENSQWKKWERKIKMRKREGNFREEYLGTNLQKHVTFVAGLEIQFISFDILR